MVARLVKTLIVLTPLAAGAQWLNVDLPPLDRDEINAERTRQPDSEGPSIGSDWDWTTMTQADLMQHALPVLAANADMCGDKVIRYRGERVCDFFPFYLSNESHPNAYTDGVDFIYITAGMVRSLRSADEYRAVIGHEIGHIISGHVVKVQRRRNRGALIGAVVGLGLAAAGANEGIAVPPSIVTSAAHIGAVFGTLRFSEQHELEADYIGAYMLARSGGDINAAKRMWRRWGVGEGAQGSWLSYHPPTLSASLCSAPRQGKSAARLTQALTCARMCATIPSQRRRSISQRFLTATTRTATGQLAAWRRGSKVSRRFPWTTPHGTTHRRIAARLPK